MKTITTMVFNIIVRYGTTLFRVGLPQFSVVAALHWDLSSISGRHHGRTTLNSSGRLFSLSTFGRPVPGFTILCAIRACQKGFMHKSAVGLTIVTIVSAVTHIFLPIAKILCPSERLPEPFADASTESVVVSTVGMCSKPAPGGRRTVG